MLPRGVVSNGFPPVQAVCARLGLSFDPWQEDLNRCILAKNAKGLYAADIAALSMARQIGKTWDIGALTFALCVIQPNLTVVWTAHRFKVARESFDSMRATALTAPLAPHVDPDDITTGAGNEQIRFRNGSRIVWAARERGSIRGFTKVDVLVLDEAQILTEQALADLVPTTNQAPNPLILAMGTPPKPTDPSDVFKRLRAEALSGESADVLYVEFAAERGSDPNDRKTWRQANPSYPKRTTARAILRMQKVLAADDFVREGLGVWDSDELPSFFGDGRWEACKAKHKPPFGQPTFAVARSVDQVWTSIGYAEETSRETWHLAPVDRRRGVHWLLEQVGALHERYPDSRWVIATTGPASQQIDDVEAVVGPERLIRCNSSEICDASADVYDLVQQRRVEHRAYPELDESVRDAQRRPVGDRWAIGRKDSDASMLEAATLALWGARQPEEAELHPMAAFV